MGQMAGRGGAAFGMGGTCRYIFSGSVPPDTPYSVANNVIGHLRPFA